MTRVWCQAVRWVCDEPFPGLVEVQLTDAAGTVWSLVDKAPVFGDDDLAPDARYPICVTVACEVVARETHADGVELVTVSTARPWGVAAQDGQDEFVVARDQIVGSLVLKEVGYDLTASRLRALASPVAREWEALALGYLESGYCIVASPGLYPDLLDPDKLIGGPYVCTDGVWVWTNDLAYYLRHYHIDLPAEFLDHMASRDWAAPEFSEDEQMAIVDEYIGPGPREAPVAPA